MFQIKMYSLVESIFMYSTNFMYRFSSFSFLIN